MAKNRSVLLLVSTLFYFIAFVSISYQSNDLDLDSLKYSENDMIFDSYHDIVKRNSDDLDIKLKKNSTKKPIITSKLDASQKGSAMKTSKTGLREQQMLPNMTVTYVDVDDDNQTALPSNTNQTIDHHTYYNSTFYSDPTLAMNFWVNITSFPRHQLVLHEMLSNSHRRAATVTLPFEFPFYGQTMTNITIATGGFLYVGDHVHSWLAATQYIAALMANFDTSLSNSSTIQYAYNETAFVIQWEDVMLHDKTPEGNFSFQIILLKNGDIIFVYKDVPFAIQEIPDSKHSVRVGISDAYIIDRTIFFIRRKTIYEYHRVDLKKNLDISNNTAIYFKALPTCTALQTCESCVSANIGFSCGWCDSVKRCSDGYDRQRQEWIVKNCDVAKEASCASNLTVTTVSPNLNISSSTQTIISPVTVERQSEINTHNGSSPLYYENESQSNSSRSSSGAGLVSLLIILAFLSGISLWVFYAYKNPQSSSGQFLIRYRPTQWRFGSSEARYTAASIHM